MNPRTWLLLFTALSNVGCSSPSPTAGATPPSDVVMVPEAPRSGEATLFLMADLRGVLRPCGCTVELQKGGFDRLIPFLAEERKRHPGAELLHAGPMFYEDEASDAKQKAQHDRQAEVTADLVARAGVTVAGATAVDDIASGGHLAVLGERAKLQLTAANLVLASGSPAPGPLVRQIGGLRVGIFALAGDPSASEDGKTGGAKPAEAERPKVGTRVTDPEAAAALAVTELRKEADVVVLLSSLGLRETKRLVRKIQGIDFAVAGGLGEHATPSDEAELVGTTRVMQFHREGRYVGRLTIRLVRGERDFADASQVSPSELAILDQRVARLEQALAELTRDRKPTDPEIRSMTQYLGSVKEHRDRLAGKKVIVPADRSSFSFTQTAIDWDLPQDPDTAALMKAFDEELARINIASAGTLPEPTPGQATYVGTEACFECHEETRAFWKKNEHAHAWVSLEEAGKTFDTDCVSCHVTGYGQASGSLVGKTQGREAVQCEACHGPGSKHCQDSLPTSVIGKPDESACSGCHNEHHSPRFQYGPYREHLLVPGHGRPPN